MHYPTYFDYNYWEIERLCNQIRERIRDSKKVIPPIVKKHAISIIYRTSENSYRYPMYGPFAYNVRPEFTTREEAEKYIESFDYVTKVSDNFYIDGIRCGETYETKDGQVVDCHYEILEYDYEEYEDGEHYVLYSDEEKKMLSEALRKIEEATVYMSVFDHCTDQGSFGDGSFSEELKEELDKFNKEFTEELPEGYEDDD